jgi:hypothetical protein
MIIFYSLYVVFHSSAHVWNSLYAFPISFTNLHFPILLAYFTPSTLFSVFSYFYSCVSVLLLPSSQPACLQCIAYLKLSLVLTTLFLPLVVHTHQDMVPYTVTLLLPLSPGMCRNITCSPLLSPSSLNSPKLLRPSAFRKQILLSPQHNPLHMIRLLLRLLNNITTCQ